MPDLPDFFQRSFKILGVKINVGKIAQFYK